MLWRNCWRRRRDIGGEFWPRAKCWSWAPLHRSCIANAGEHAAALEKIDWIFGVQGDAAEIGAGSRSKRGIQKSERDFSKIPGEAAKFIADFIERGDLLLLKGSRGVRMEKILEAIEARHHARRRQESAGKEPWKPGRKGRS